MLNHVIFYSKLVSSIIQYEVLYKSIGLSQLPLSFFSPLPGKYLFGVPKGPDAIPEVKSKIIDSLLFNQGLLPYQSL